MGWGAAWFRAFFLSPEAGAKTAVFLAYSPKVEAKSGGYYVRCRQRKPSKKAQDFDLAEQLWQRSETLIKQALLLQYSFRHFLMDLPHETGRRTEREGRGRSASSWVEISFRSTDRPNVLLQPFHISHVMGETG